MKNLLYITLTLLIMSCTTKDSSENIEEEGNPDIEGIQFSKDQVELAGIKTGKLVIRTIYESIDCSGTIEALPQNIASVSPIINGFIKKLNYFPGEAVKKGDVLATMIHPDFLTLQQQYIEAKTQVDYYKEEFKRQGELTVENAASVKKMQKAKADFLTIEANYNALKAQLELLGVNTQYIEKEGFVKDFKLIAPISGTISQLKANNGKYVGTEDFIYEIINGSVLNVNLNVYEKDISKIKPGQKLEFQILNRNELFTAKVKRTGIKINESNRTTIVQSTINNKNKVLKPGMFVNAKLHTTEKEAYTISSEAILEFDNESFVFILKEDKFISYKIKKGFEQDDIYEIIDPDKELINADIVIEGTYYLMDKLKAEE